MNHKYCFHLFPLVFLLTWIIVRDNNKWIKISSCSKGINTKHGNGLWFFLRVISYIRTTTMTKKYKCDRCNYSTDSRQNFWQHQNRTKKCSVQRLEIESKNNLLSSRTCAYCNKVFSTNSNMNRHVKQYCKVRKSREAQIQPHIINNHITNNMRMMLLKWVVKHPRQSY